MTKLNTPDNHKNLFVILTAGFLTVVAMSNIGCATFEPMRAKQGDLEATVSGESKSEPDESYIVEVHPAIGQPKIFKGQTSKLNSIETAIASSTAKKFRNMDIELYRKDSVTGKIIKMTSVYEPQKRYVTPETDYTIHAGDRVVIRQKSNSFFEKAASNLFGNLGS